MPSSLSFSRVDRKINYRKPTSGQVADENPDDSSCLDSGLSHHLTSELLL